MTRNLLLTLGHNSSAILIEDNKVAWGYETERITGVKSDSRFPKPVLDAYLRGKIDSVYVTHWAPSGKLADMAAKYWNPSLFDGIPIRTLSFDRTHHDTHIAGARCYAGEEFFKGAPVYGLVVDGFGTLGEHFSVYQLTANGTHCIRRFHGYDTSLGLWYQYATAFMGMKMHEDEYKLLGYETLVNEADVESLNIDASLAASEWLGQMQRSIYGSKFDPMYNLSALEEVRAKIYRQLTKVCQDYNISDPTTIAARAILAYYVQRVLELVVLQFVKDLAPTKLLLSGGCFYNVKLNKRIIDEVNGKVCVYPLAGDQGNALGLYAMDHPEFKFPSDLNWGHRTLKSYGQVENLRVMGEHHAYSTCMDLVEKFGAVNLVRGSMEFGPRAMCNTSTLAIPTHEVVARINAANNRNTVMPMAPVMTRNDYNFFFKHTDRVHKSEEHMIVALEWANQSAYHLRCYDGVMHHYNHPYPHYTGRPQVVRADDDWMNQFVGRIGPVINTSFNFHGLPIAFDMESVIKNHVMQQQRDNSFQTVVIQNA